MTKLSKNARDFVDETRLHSLLRRSSEPVEVRDVLAKSMAKEPLSVDETAMLLRAESPDDWAAVFDAAGRLKRDIYGNRIVLFAPLYIGNDCTNDCTYCAFRRSNRRAERKTLGPDEIEQQVAAIEGQGHRRCILVFGEHPRYDARFMAECARRVYSVRAGRGEIRRINLNAAPLDHAGFATVKAAGIGTYQIFQETYHHATYANVHPAGTPKGDYLWRLDGVARAIEAGCDDVGIGALFGLYDWRFEVLGLVAHAAWLKEHYGVGPHTISFPRLRPALGTRIDDRHAVSDEDFRRLVAVLRLAVPYTGMILTAREPAAVRREVLRLGVSQIDAGSRIELGGYTDATGTSHPDREQFHLADERPLDEVIAELIGDGYLPSFCTACYRLGRTGEQFMEYAEGGHIQNLCTPNAITTLAEYLADYASPETREAGLWLIERETAKLPETARTRELIDRLRRIGETGQRDLYF